MSRRSCTYTTHLYRVDTTTTDATEDNRPGPGRGLDKLFQRGGQRLERLLSKVIRPSQQTSLVKLQRTDTVSTNATEDNRVGLGRGLDNLFQAGGRKLERLLGATADRMGYGPAATEKRIVVVMYRLRESGYFVERKSRAEEWRRYTMNDKQRMDKEIVLRCKRLMKYLKYVHSVCGFARPDATRETVLQLHLLKDGRSQLSWRLLLVTPLEQAQHSYSTMQ